MAKSTIIAVLALSLALGGLGGLGLVMYQTFFAVPASSGIKNTWYKYYNSSIYTNPVSTQIVIDELLIEFSIDVGESVYFLFNTEAIVDNAATMQINFVLDGTLLDGPSYPCCILTTLGNMIAVPVSLQMSLSTLTVGLHTITIQIYGTTSIFNRIFYNTFLVQTYIP